MILGYESLRAKINQACGEKCKNVILATYSNHLFLLIFFVFFYTHYTFIMMMKYAMLFGILYVLVMLYIVFILLTNRVGIGINEDRLVYVKFSGFGFKSKKVYCIDFDKIKYLYVKKILFNTNVKMSFIDWTGKLVKVNFRYTKTVLGISGNDQQNNGKVIVDKLIELQKVLDSGDF